jgi:IS5 family transposase
MVGLHYLKRTFDLSDEAVVARWVENPYWQYFCGMLNFTHELPIDPSLMTRWRRRLKSEGMEKLLEETIRLRLVTGVISGASFSKVNVDTTVQEKAITYPTDAKLYHRLREKLVSAAESLGATFGRATGSYRQTRCSCRGVTPRRVSRGGRGVR